MKPSVDHGERRRRGAAIGKAPHRETPNKQLDVSGTVATTACRPARSAFREFAADIFSRADAAQLVVESRGRFPEPARGGT